MSILLEYSCVSVQNLAMDTNMPANKKRRINLGLENSNVELKANKEGNKRLITNLSCDEKNTLISFLNPCDVGNILCTCKNFKDFLESKEFCFKNFITIRFDMIWNDDSNNIRYIKYEYIPKVLLDKVSSIYIEYDPEIDKRKCNTCEISSFDFASTFNNEIKIENLDLTCAESQFYILKILNQAQSLRFTSIEKFNLNTLASYDYDCTSEYAIGTFFLNLFPNLKTLNIEGDWEIFECMVQEFINANVTNLDFNCRFYDDDIEHDEDFSYIHLLPGPEFKNLKELSLCLCDSESINARKAKLRMSIMGAPENLEKLVIYSGKEVVLEFDKFESPKNLKALYIDICLNKYESYSLEFLKRLSYLDKLDLKISVNGSSGEKISRILYPKNLKLKDNWNIKWPKDLVKVEFVD